MNKKIISFDLDGTLVDRRFDDAVWLEEVPRLYAKKKKISLAKANAFVKRKYDSIGDGRREWYDLGYWLKKFGLRKAKGQIIRDLKHLISFYPDALPALKALKKKGVRIIVVSNSDREFVKAKLEAGGLASFFDNVFSATSDFKTLKGERDFFAMVCRECGVRPEQLIHVGDHYEFDYLAPRKCGITAFLIDRDGNRRGDFVVKNLREFEEKICSA